MSNAAESIDNSEDPNKTKAEVVKTATSDAVDRMEHGEKNDSHDDDSPVDPRQAIYDNYDKSRSGESDEDESKPDDEPAEPNDDDSVIEEGEPKADSEPVKKDPEMTTVKINGVEKLVEKSKVDNAGGVVAYQKLHAAEQKLLEASENQRILNDQAEQLRKREESLNEREQALSTKKDAPDSKPNDPPEIDGDQKKALAEKVKLHREAIYEGEDDLADQLMLDIWTMARDSNATTQNFLDEIGDKATQRALETLEQKQFEKERVSAVDRFNTEYEDVASDPKLRALADTRSGELFEEHPDWSPERIILEAAKETREWFQGAGGGQSDEQSSSTQVNDSALQKMSDKRSLSTPSSASGRKVQKQTKQAESNSEYIQRLKKERGLA